jgi:hypothetical protein
MYVSWSSMLASLFDWFDSGHRDVYHECQSVSTTLRINLAIRHGKTKRLCSTFPSIIPQHLTIPSLLGMRYYELISELKIISDRCVLHGWIQKDSIPLLRQICCVSEMAAKLLTRQDGCGFESHAYSGCLFFPLRVKYFGCVGATREYRIIFHIYPCAEQEVESVPKSSRLEVGLTLTTPSGGGRILNLD